MSTITSNFTATARWVPMSVEVKTKTTMRLVPREGDTNEVSEANTGCEVAATAFVRGRLP